MKNAASKAIAISKALDAVIRDDRGRLIASLVSKLGDIQIAEDALQEASISALNYWARSDPRPTPPHQIMTVAASAIGDVNTFGHLS